jgi:nicotinamide-nucleotide amidase
MLAELITIGDEILIGQIVDTNSAWMAQQLNAIGITVKQISSVSDNHEHILTALREARQRAGIILITGGLGPTKDDITKVALCDYFKCKLVFNQAQFNQVEAIFKSFGREVSPVNRKQAEVPELCECIVNLQGTAPAMWFDQEGITYVSMPGVPYEMKGIMEHDILPRLKERFRLPVIQHRTFLTQGVGESMLAGWIESWEDALPPNMKLAYLPNPGMVRLRISATGSDANELTNQIEEQARKLYELIGEHIYGEGEQTLPELILELLGKQQKTLSLAESCTGGNISHLITEIPGSSSAYLGGVVSYSNELKIKLLGVNRSTLETRGAVSEETALEMASGALKHLGSDYSIAITGIAGPDGGSEEKPVGTVWIAIAGPDFKLAKKFQFSKDRVRNITMASLSALNMLRKKLITS